MNKHDIASHIKKRGHSGAAIARELGTSTAAVLQVVYGNCRSKRVERRISEITGFPLDRLWPQWYAERDPAKESSDPLMCLSARLIAERERLGFDPSTMAAIGKVTPEQQMLYECGAIAPDLLYLVRLSRSTHLDALYVISGRRESGRAGG